VDWRLELVQVPVSDVDRAKAFYTDKAGFNADHDHQVSDELRFVQLTPPGSPTSIALGTGLSDMPPGSVQGLQMVVPDIDAARAELVASGVDASEVFHCAQGYGCRYPGRDGRVDGRAPDGGTYGSFVTFSDPDGNGWILQEVTARFPGRVAGDTTYPSANDLAQALRRAAAAHGEHEIRTGEADVNWPDWYAQYMVREQAGQELPL
jgi:catechol 2,3-dioxygenase-like lactoylglutathione lyase family enzyme